MYIQCTSQAITLLIFFLSFFNILKLKQTLMINSNLSGVFFLALSNETKKNALLPIAFSITLHPWILQHGAAKGRKKCPREFIWCMYVRPPSLYLSRHSFSRPITQIHKFEYFPTGNNCTFNSCINCGSWSGRLVHARCVFPFIFSLHFKKKMVFFLLFCHTCSHVADHGKMLSKKYFARWALQKWLLTMATMTSNDHNSCQRYDTSRMCEWKVSNSSSVMIHHQFHPGMISHSHSSPLLLSIHIPFCPNAPGRWKGSDRVEECTPNIINFRSPTLFRCGILRNGMHTLNMW